MPVITVGIDKIVGLLVLLCTGITILVLWINPDRAWLHPELLAIGSRVSSAPRGLRSFLSLVIDWHQFSGDTRRERFVTGLFEVTDAWVRPYIAQVFAHPAVSVTTVLYAALVPTLLYQTLRLFSLSGGQALLFCAFLIATPGFLSNLFAYIHAGKPLSYILIGATVFSVAQYSIERRGGQLVLISAILLIGLLTDELLLWNVIFILWCLILLGVHRPVQRLLFALGASLAIYAVTLFLLLPWVYETFGSYGKEPPVLLPSTGEHPVVRMLSYLFLPDFYRSAGSATARSLLAAFGYASTSAIAIGIAAIFIVAGLCILMVYIRKRNQDTWKLAAVALFGLCSFASFGMWLLWYNGPPALEGYGSLNYYYNSPISFFVVLFVAAAFRSIVVSIGDGSSSRSAFLSTLVLAVFLSVAIVSSGRTFLKLNDLVRFIHLGPTDTVSFFSVVSDGYQNPSPQLIIMTDDKNRLQRMLMRAQREGKELFGDYSPASINAAYYERSYFDDMQWYGPSFAHFGQGYGHELCVAYFRMRPCPVNFQEASLPMNKP